MNPIFQGLEQGYEPEEILKYISKAIPKLVPQINRAMSSGYGIKEILGFLAKTSTNEDTSGMSESQIHARNRKVDSKLVQNGLMTAGAVGGTALTANAYRGALSRAMPSQVQSLFGGDIPSPDAAQTQPSQTLPGQQQQIAPSIQGQTLSQQPPVNEPTIPQSPQVVQPEGINIDPTALLSKHGLIKHVEEISKKQKDPKAIAGILYSKYPKEMQAFQKEAGKNMEEAIGDYLQTKPPVEQIPESNESAPTKAIEVGGEKVPIAKNETVASPQGIGEVKEIRNGKALIDVDGKLTKVDVKDLESEPKHIASLYDDLFNAIPDEYKSRMMNYAGYDEEHNELIFRPHGGAAYVYKEIPSEFADELKNRLHRARTTGKNMYGMWYEGDQSYGAGMSKLIRELQAQYGGKGKEYIRKYNTLFDILGIPHEEKKRKEREERERRKRNG